MPVKIESDIDSTMSELGADGLYICAAGCHDTWAWYGQESSVKIKFLHETEKAYSISFLGGTPFFFVNNKQCSLMLVGNNDLACSLIDDTGNEVDLLLSIGQNEKIYAKITPYKNKTPSNHWGPLPLRKEAKPKSQNFGHE